MRQELQISRRLNQGIPYEMHKYSLRSATFIKDNNSRAGAFAPHSSHLILPVRSFAGILTPISSGMNPDLTGTHGILLLDIKAGPGDKFSLPLQRGDEI